MQGKPAARVSDPTACPVPGHGTSPIVSGSPDVFFDGLPVARQGDPSACGGALSGNLAPNVFINGLPVATLGSIGSHGNVVIGGSGTVIIGTAHAAAPTSPISSPVARSGLCLPCLLAAAARNDALVPLESLVAKP
ncbi:PAAR domain-containing protein [Stutzerimonas nitrititolerans]|uniref:PAAR domain-containing protein n=1 Tax=Stutzerimonas nitrititolerans TaxID=2482751 RepID=UPI0028A16E62|nr:PAAR domain-containing protein [Stutzerimonas nitrititolerans]